MFQSLPEDILDFKAKVQLKNSERDYHVIEYYGYKQGYPTEEPVRVYFGQWVRH